MITQRMGWSVGGLLAVCAAASGGAPQFWNLGTTLLPDDANGDGSLIVGGNSASGQYFIWNAMSGAMDIGGATAGAGGAGHARISDNGSFVGGTSFNGVSGLFEMGRYDVGANQWSHLGGIGGSSDSSLSSGWGMSRDGQHQVGLGWIDAGTGHGAQWSAGGGGIFDLGSSVTDRSSRANAVNDDGSVVVGWQDLSDGTRTGAVWNNGVQTVINGAGEAGAVSADGNWVVGASGADTNNQAWRWSESTGIEMLGTLGLSGFPPPRGSATDISSDGSMILGFERGFGPPTSGEGWLWTESGGMQPLESFFAASGVAFPSDFHFSLPLGMSTDGKTFFGWGRSDSAFVTGWVVTIPSPAGASLLGLGLLGAARCRR